MHTNDARQIDRLVAENIDLRAEVERLREALEKLADFGEGHATYSGGLMNAAWVRDVAREALSDITALMPERETSG